MLPIFKKVEEYMQNVNLNKSGFKQLLIAYFLGILYAGKNKFTKGFKKTSY